MDEIKQTLGFDAAQALATLTALDQGFAKFEQRLGSVSKTLQSFNSNSGTAAKSLGTSFKSGMGEATASTERLTTSLSLLSRIAFTQAVVRGMSQIRNAIQSTGKEAIEFQKRLALVSTIDDTRQSFGKLSDSVRKLSDDFNIPLLQAADGLYQSLSNQVGDFGTSLEFTAEAAQFAKATNSSLADSVDLLSGALKSYNLDASETERVSGIFFKTIDLGRITATELANSFGRVGPIASELGVSLEETAGAMAAISVKGSKTSETLTQFRAILSALQKPTPELTKALHDLGFSSSEAAIKTLGLPGVLRSLADSSGGSAEKMAKLFPNIRGLAGATSLASDDFRTLAKNIDEMTAAGANLSKEKFFQATANDGEKLTKEINKLKNAFTVELGQSVLKSGVELSQWVGGADSVVSAAKSAGPILIGLGVSFATMKASIAASNAELGLLSKGLGAIALVPVAIGAGQSIGNFIDDKALAKTEAALAKVREQNKADLEAFKANAAEKLSAANKADDARVKSILKTTQTLNRSYIQDVENSKRSNDALVTNTQSALDKILSARERLVDALAKGAADSRTIAKDSRGRQTDLSDRANDRAFDNSTKRLSDAAQVFAITKRAQELASKAASDLLAAGKSGDTDAISRAAAAFSKAQSLGESAASIGERAGSRQLEAQAAKGLAEITQRQLVAEQQLQNLQSQRAAALDKERAKQQAIVDEIRKQVKVVTDNTSQFDSNGQQFNETDLTKRAGLRQAALKKIAESALSQKDLTAQGALGIADFVSRNQAALSRDPINLAFSVENGAAKIQADLTKAFASFKLGVNVAPLENALGKQFANPDQFIQGVSEAQAKVAALRQQLETAAGESEKVKGINRELDTTFNAVAQRKNVRNTFQDSFSAGLRKDFDAALALFQKTRNQADITAADVRKVFDALQKVQNVAGSDTVGRLGFSHDLIDLAKAVPQLQALGEAKAAATANVSEQLRGLESALAQSNPAGQFKAASDAIGAGVAPAEKVADALSRAADSAERLSKLRINPELFGPPTAQALGGRLALAAGGQAKGTDSVATMLTPGEFVVNARSSQRFFSQLQAINAGQAPSSVPGSVTNNSIGDITVHVDGGEGGHATGRQIAQVLRREFRRGTARV